jgi:hypothetical protein
MDVQVYGGSILVVLSVNRFKNISIVSCDNIIGRLGLVVELHLVPLNECLNAFEHSNFLRTLNPFM